MAWCCSAPSHYQNNDDISSFRILRANFAKFEAKSGYFISIEYGGKYFLLQGAMLIHYSEIIVSMMASQITSLTIVYSTVYSGVDQRKHQSSASLAFVQGIHRWQLNSPHKGPVTRKMFPFDDVIMLEPYHHDQITSIILSLEHMPCL